MTIGKKWCPILKYFRKPFSKAFRNAHLSSTTMVFFFIFTQFRGRFFSISPHPPVSYIYLSLALLTYDVNLLAYDVIRLSSDRYCSKIVGVT